MNVRKYSSETNSSDALTAVMISPWEPSRHYRSVGLDRVVEIHQSYNYELASIVVHEVNASWLVAGPKLDEGELQKMLTSVRAVQPNIRFAMLGDGEDWRRCEAWMRKGCQVYLEASSSLERVSAALHHSTTYDVAIADQAFLRLRQVRRAVETPDLTKREREVLDLLHRGLRNREIAMFLHITENTVEYHMKHILQKLGARSRLEAVERSTALGLI